MSKYEWFPVKFSFQLGWEKERIIWGQKPQAAAYCSILQLHLLDRPAVLAQETPKTSFVLFFYESLLDTTTQYLVYFCQVYANRTTKTGTISKRKCWYRGIAALRQGPGDSRKFWHFCRTANNPCTLESLKEIFYLLQIEFSAIWCLFNSLGNRKWTESTTSHAGRQATSYQAGNHVGSPQHIWFYCSYRYIYLATKNIYILWGMCAYINIYSRV